MHWRKIQQGEGSGDHGVCVVLFSKPGQGRDGIAAKFNGEQ